ncbi:hypothetical protein GUITHDRAFT_121793 [Guillardia theta CCMP2712]|uniref:Dynein light intermediate chain n=1 Tax=Guillardia theta (strain CCMP2712) TaxID=905079 RepID=L1I6Z9_GUITC|nr:hypothetical protein GUITHDRAFT_121793 [Guillardia theta CCMP2712]EKX32026.1 hypothetical protein GUITHDRAFT_121793 [Guillardia theta CCMP2712]|eukprot:XP_005819006.1 hypothetical protein GUITHDRAFT_121793 [Guillardia theta CCMP2712]
MEDAMTWLNMMGLTSVGKTCLWASLQSSGRNQTVPAASPVRFAYSELDASDSDDGRHVLGVWLASDGSQAVKTCMRSARAQESLGDTVLLLCVDLSEPWRLSSALVDGIRTASESIKDCTNIEELEFSQLFPELQAMDLNIGVPLVVVGCKCDVIDTIPADDVLMMQYILRTFCLGFGLSLTFTSSKTLCNISRIKNLLNSMLWNVKSDISPQSCSSLFVRNTTREAEDKSKDLFHADDKQLLEELNDILSRETSHGKPPSSIAKSSHSKDTPSSRVAKVQEEDKESPATEDLRSKVSQGQVNDQVLTDYFASLLQKPPPSTDRKKTSKAMKENKGIPQ